MIEKTLSVGGGGGGGSIKVNKKKNWWKNYEWKFFLRLDIFFTIAAAATATADGGGGGGGGGLFCTCKVVSPLAPVFVPIFL